MHINATRTEAMFKPFAFIFFILIMVWCGAILITTSAQERMNRACIPIDYTGKASSAAMLLINDDWSVSTQQIFEKWSYGCKFVIWRLFYEDTWNAMSTKDRSQAVREQAQELGTPQQTQTPSSEPAQEQARRIHRN